MPASQQDAGLAATTPWRRLLGDLRDATLRSYAQILFSRSRLVGLVLLLATCVLPRAALFGLAATGVSFAVTRLFGLSEDLTRTGLFGYNALLVGLGGAVLFGSTLDAHVLILLGVVTAVFMTASLYSLLGLGFNLPPLTLPFLLVFYLVLGAARVLDVPMAPLLPMEPLLRLPLPETLTLYLQSLGALFFLPRADAGLLVLLALVLHSRIGTLLSWFGFGLALLVAGRLLLIIDGSLPMVLGYNFILASIALGGIWFVPSPSSMLLAAGGTLVCGLAAVGLVPYMTIAALPLLILPFNLTVILLLYAMRQRLRDGQPKAVDFAIGTPEENLNYYRTHIARFGAHYRVRFRAPFRGRWVCTQGVQGQLTHRDQWRHAFDFEVQGPDHKTYRGNGDRREDYLCYRLPVLAPADGTVVRVIDDVEDNPVGQQNLRQNWGNLVLIYHAPGVYSLVAHLARGSTRVREGQIVRQADELGLCGSSGRSPIPHLHFQLQASPVVGAPTIHGELHDVVTDRDGQLRLCATLVPRKGDVVRNIEPTDTGPFLNTTEGEVLTFEIDGEGEGRTEIIDTEVDLLGRRLFRSRLHGTIAYFERDDALMRILDVQGSHRSVLHLLQAALASVPSELHEALGWSDHLQLRWFLATPLRSMLDLVSPFFPSSTELVMDYEIVRQGAKLAVVGRSRRRRAGRPMVTTRADFGKERDLKRVEVTVGRRKRVATRVHDVSDPESSP